MNERYAFALTLCCLALGCGDDAPPGANPDAGAGSDMEVLDQALPVDARQPDQPIDRPDGGREAGLVPVDAGVGSEAGVDGGLLVPPAGNPVLAFVDLTFAPNSGWSGAEPTRGAVVTVWGRNFGNERGDSFVRVNGTELRAEADYVDDWGETNNPVPFLQTITFQLHDGIDEGEGEIVVSVNGVESNALPFRIGEGRIFFIDANAGEGNGRGTIDDPFGDPEDFIDTMQPGDIAYLREGVFNRKYNGGKANIWIRDTETSGTADAPIAFVGYPNEIAMFDSITDGTRANFNRSIDVDSRHITIAKVHSMAFGTGIAVGPYGRAVGNDLVGTTNFVSGTGIIIAGDGPVILGNAVHGARSGNRLDHSIYLNGCAHTRGAEVAYNHSFDNSFDRGPHFIVNHQEDRCGDGQYLKSHRIHHNVVDCSGSPSRAIAVFDQSWDEGEPVEPEPTYVYNNLAVACGQDDFPAMFNRNGHGVFVNNTLYNTVGKGFIIDRRGALSTVFVNNIVHLSDPSKDYFGGEGYTVVRNNLVFGGRPGSEEGEVIEADPAITLDISRGIFAIAPDSAAINAGDSTMDDLPQDDFFNHPRDGQVDVGALEFSSAR
ncbi:MAG: hypothetical protein AAF411_04945 [Myxococcota bacterium]